MVSRIGWCWMVIVLALFGCGAEEGNREQMVDLEVLTVEDPEKQLVSLSEAISRSKRDASLYTRRAMAYLRKGDLEEGLKDVDMAISLAKDEPSNYFVKAQILYMLGRTKEALPLALQAQRNSYQSPSLYVLLSELYLQQGDYEQAGVFIKKALELSPDDEYAFYHQGRLLAETGDTARAIRSYRKALEQRADFMEPHRELTGLYLTQHEPVLARQHLNEATKVAKQQDALLWYFRGLLQLEASRKDSAQQSFQQAVTLTDTLQGAHYQLGLLQHGLGNYDASLEHLNKAKKDFEQRVRYWTVLASSYERLGENLPALRAYERVVALEPRHTFAWQSIARLKYRLERPRPQLDSMAVRRSVY